MSIIHLQLLTFFLPALVGLLAVGAHLLTLLKLANAQQSKATPFILSFVLMLGGIILTWIFILIQTLALFEVLFTSGGLLLYSWQVLLLPVFWAVMTLWLNNLVRK